jgi:hypothetical protein
MGCRYPGPNRSRSRTSVSLIDFALPFGKPVVSMNSRTGSGESDQSNVSTIVVPVAAGVSS